MSREAALRRLLCSAMRSLACSAVNRIATNATAPRISSLCQITLEKQRLLSSSHVAAGNLLQRRTFLSLTPFVKRAYEAKLKEKIKTREAQQLVLYKCKYIRPIRLAIRLKVFQFAGCFAAAALAAAFVFSADPKVEDVAAVVAVIVGCVVGTWCTNFYGKRIVGELSLLLPEKRTVRFSTLDFWGNRKDSDYPVDWVIPPLKNLNSAQVRNITSGLLWPVKVRGRDVNFYLSNRWGIIIEKEIMLKLLDGRYMPELDASTHMSSTLGQQPEIAKAAAGSATNETHTPPLTSIDSDGRGPQP